MNIHFIGCAGASMRGLMRIAEHEGARVSGSDLSLCGHDASFVTGADLAVYSSAVPADNPEITYAAQHGIPLMSRAQFLGQTAARYGTVIAVAGSHGKTTATAMLGCIFAPFDATVHLGGEYCARNERITDVFGKRYFITEACEYRRNFLYLAPRVSVVLNVELDHTDYYRDLNDITSAFSVFSQSAALRVLCGDDQNSRPLRVGKFVDFGFEEHCVFRAADVRPMRGGTRFVLLYRGRALGEIELNVPGRHNVYNALAAAAVALGVGLPFAAVRDGLRSYGGVKRRLEKLGAIGSCDVFTDYAHHPREIESTLRCLREAGYERIGAAFEPHTFSRTRSLLDAFAEALLPADDLLLGEIYPAREQPICGVSGQLLCRRLLDAGKPTRCFPTFFQLNEAARVCMARNDAFVYMGAGTIDIAARRLFCCD